jgi:hypothetical protein
MFTARETTSSATTSEIASSAIIMSFAHDLIAETSVGLNAVAVVKERCSPELGRQYRAQAPGSQYRQSHGPAALAGPGRWTRGWLRCRAGDHHVSGDQQVDAFAC